MGRLRSAWAALWGRSTYAGAKTTNSTGDWTPLDAGVNELTRNANASLRARARQLVRDMPHAARAVNVLAGAVVGDGLTLQAKVVDPVTGELADQVNGSIEDAWRFWCDEADLARRLHFHELQALAVRGQVEVGESLHVKRQTHGTGRYLPFALSCFEPDHLADWTTNPLPGNTIDQGVEFDPRTGRVMRYHFIADETTSRSIPVPADQVVHGFQPLRPNQLRGVTAFAPALLLAHSLRDYLESTIDTARLASRIFAWVTSADPIGTLGAMGGHTDPNAPSGTSRKIEEVGSAIREYLAANESVTVHNPQQPGDQFDPFTRFVLRTLAAVLGVSYELLSGDYSGMNYSVGKASREAFNAGIQVHRQRFIRQFCAPVYREFLDWAVLTKRLTLPNYFVDPWPYLRVSWIGPGMQSLDPLRETRADVEAVKYRLKSPQEILLSRGRDPEQVLDEIQAWQRMLDARDLDAQAVSSALATNPAAVDPDAADGAGTGKGRALWRVMQ